VAHKGNSDTATAYHVGNKRFAPDEREKGLDLQGKNDREALTHETGQPWIRVKIYAASTMALTDIETPLSTT